MSWDAIGAIANITGAFAVVLSLVYLAIQVRDNTRSSRSATRQAIVDSIVAVNLTLPQSEQFAQTFRDHLDGNDIPRHQQLQLTAFCYAYLRNWENVYFQYRSGLLSDEDWRGFRQNVKALLQTTAFLDFWKREGAVFSHAFQDEVRWLLAEPASPVLQQAVIFSRPAAALRDAASSPTTTS